MGMHHIWSGSVTDTKYTIPSTILDDTIIFAQNDCFYRLSNVPFDILDKGYIITLEYKDGGWQRTL